MLSEIVRSHTPLEHRYTLARPLDADPLEHHTFDLEGGIYAEAMGLIEREQFLVQNGVVGLAQREDVLWVGPMLGILAIGQHMGYV